MYSNDAYFSPLNTQIYVTNGILVTFMVKETDLFKQGL